MCPKIVSNRWPTTGQSPIYSLTKLLGSRASERRHPERVDACVQIFDGGRVGRSENVSQRAVDPKRREAVHGRPGRQEELRALNVELAVALHLLRGRGEEDHREL